MSKIFYGANATLLINGVPVIGVKLPGEDLSPIESEVWEFLKKFGPASCSSIGAEVFGRHKQYPKAPQAYARPAGKVIKRLVEKGYVRRKLNPTSRFDRGHWEAKVKNLYRHLTWTIPNARPWVCFPDQNYGARPIKDATLRRLINAGLFPYRGKTPNAKHRPLKSGTA